MQMRAGNSSKEGNQTQKGFQRLESKDYWQWQRKMVWEGQSLANCEAL